MCRIGAASKGCPRQMVPSPLLQSASFVPIDDVDELPGIFVELEFELPLFVDDQLCCGKENTSALILVGIVDVDFTCSQVVSGGLGVVIRFTESQRAVGDKANLAARWRRNQTDETKVVAGRASDGNTANGLHLSERIHQPLILALLKGLNEYLPVFLRRELVDSHFDVD